MNLKDFLEKNKSKFDVYEPKSGHEDQFMAKLKNHKTPEKASFLKQYYKKLLIAASVSILLTLGFQYFKFEKQKRVVNTGIQENERYFSQIIKAEISQIKKDETPETQKVFKDAMKQIDQLETAYQQLIKDYKINQDKYILNAMIENFQQRIDILQFVKQEIKRIKDSKSYQDEKYRA